MIGALLGQIKGLTIEISNSFAVPHTEDENEIVCCRTVQAHLLAEILCSILHTLSAFFSR